MGVATMANKKTLFVTPMGCADHDLMNDLKHIWVNFHLFVTPMSCSDVQMLRCGDFSSDDIMTDKTNCFTI